MNNKNIVEKFKFILSGLPTTRTFKQQLESLLSQYTNDDEISLRMLIEQTYDLISEKKKSSSKSDTLKEASERTKSTAGTVKQKTTQELLNDIIDQWMSFWQKS